MGEPLVTMTETGTRGAMLRAYDKATGEDVGAVYMPAQQSGSPMTYLVNGVQYVVVAISGGGIPESTVPFGCRRSRVPTGVTAAVWLQSWWLSDRGVVKLGE